MLPALWMLLVLLTAFKANLVNANKTFPTDRCNVDKQNTVVAKIELLESEIVNLKYRLNTLNIIIDQLFEELNTAIADIPSQNIIPDTGTDKQSVAHETESKPAQQLNTINPHIIPSFCRGHQNETQLIKIPNSKLGPFYVHCIKDQHPDGAPWLLIQRRRNGNVDFYRTWDEYQRGFGNLEDEFFIGLEKLYALTHFTMYELWIEMEDFFNQTLWARYSSFAIGDERESYALNVLGSFTGNAGDALDYHAGQKFTTKDVDNDNDVDNNCAVTANGGWWYKDCGVGESNLNGKYYKNYDKNFGAININPIRSAIVWNTWNPYAPLKYVHMAIRPLYFKDVELVVVPNKK